MDTLYLTRPNSPFDTFESQLADYFKRMEAHYPPLYDIPSMQESARYQAVSHLAPELKRMRMLDKICDAELEPMSLIAFGVYYDHEAFGASKITAELTNLACAKVGHEQALKFQVWATKKLPF